MKHLTPMLSLRGTNHEGLFIADILPHAMAFDAVGGRSSHYGRSGHHRLLSDSEALRHARHLVTRLLAKDQESIRGSVPLRAGTK